MIKTVEFFFIKLYKFENQSVKIELGTVLIQLVYGFIACLFNTTLRLKKYECIR